ncbi:hypothetical protein LEP1GSC185_3273 [Leptospira licerasiae serovar Varillal str. VAR 010]|uniref:Uncharacterized protein n=1 Tax=Leptospira licerasiae str. MMD4847 TaxID=1049971 RepID=A0ABP2RG00_9LEPT|nr:hypothetical protein LEP1GSC185_3273 [Leptospira licerasiae serovar Varillal str. VAR 010]EJZ42470.1 hypothetical protein LEP1GSC178_2889 [Leptospira licerasiae str. MMD4847]
MCVLDSKPSSSPFSLYNKWEERACLNITILEKKDELG